MLWWLANVARSMAGPSSVSSLAVRTDFTEQDDKVGYPHQSIAIEVGFTTALHAAEIPQEDNQIGRAHNPISGEVSGASNLCDFTDLHEAVAVVVNSLVGSRCTGILERVCIVAVADVVVGVVVHVDDSGACLKGVLAILVDASVTSIGASKSTNGGAVVQDAICLLGKAIDAPGTHGRKQNGGFDNEATCRIRVKSTIQTCGGSGDVHLRGAVAKQHQVVLVALGLQRTCPGKGRANQENPEKCRVHDKFGLGLYKYTKSSLDPSIFASWASRVTVCSG